MTSDRMALVAVGSSEPSEHLFTIDCAGYVICPEKSEWQITFACKPRLTIFRVLYSKYYYMNLMKIWLKTNFSL